MKKILRYITNQPHIDPYILFVTLGIVVCAGIIIESYTALGITLRNTQEQLDSRNQELAELKTDFLNQKNTNTTLQNQLQEETIRNNQFSEQISSINSTVGQLYKLSQTDKELLQKYSNVYFLNENYIPATLSDIDPLYLARKEKTEKIHTTIKIYLETLLRDANKDNIPLSVLSAYRSFGTQASLKTNYKIQYGTTAANKFSADQGYSEHQLGSTVDFTTLVNGENLDKFEKSTAYQWLIENAFRYGFILSYPKGNDFYQFEPWHWRFVGVELATKLHTERKYFYDLDQREINSYLVKIFD